MTQLIADGYRVDHHLASINHSEFHNGFDVQALIEGMLEKDPAKRVSDRHVVDKLDLILSQF